MTALRDPRFRNSNGSCTRYAFCCGHIERKSVIDGTVMEYVGLIGTPPGHVTVEPVKVDLYMEHECYHAQRSDWCRIRDGNGGNGSPAWFSTGSLTAARQAARILRRRLLTEDDIARLNAMTGK